MAHSAPRHGRIVDFAEFVKGRRRAAEGQAPEAPAPADAPYLPGFENRERPLTARAVEHRRRMLGHLGGTRGR